MAQGIDPDAGNGLIFITAENKNLILCRFRDHKHYLTGTKS